MIEEEFQGGVPIHQRRHIAATVITIFVLGIVGVFAWRVLYFVELLRSGDLTAEDLSFVSEQSLSAQLAALPLVEGKIDVESDDDPSIGQRAAAVTIVEFGDFGCPYSRASSFVVRALARTHRDNVRLIYRDFPIDELHPDARLAAEAGGCANEQGKFWEYHDKVYVNQTDLRKEKLVQFAQELDLQMDKFRVCLESGRYAAEVRDDYASGVAAGVRGTPTFFVNGVRIPGAIPEEVFEKLIRNFLATDE